MSLAEKINKKLNKFGNQLDKSYNRFERKISQPIYRPLNGLWFIILAAVLVFSANHCTGYFCGLGFIVPVLLSLAVGILYMLVSGVVVGIKYRKTIVWKKWLLLWILAIAFSVGIIFLAAHLPLP